MVIGVHNSDTNIIDTSPASYSHLANAAASNEEAGYGNVSSDSSSSSFLEDSAIGSSNVSNDKPSSAAGAIDITEDARKAVEFWESENQSVKLKSTLKEIAKEAYRIHYTEKRGITRNDLVERLGYTDSYAKKILYECKSNNLLVHLKGHKQGKFKEYFLAIEIDQFL
jgi:hypothetical protein